MEGMWLAVAALITQVGLGVGIWLTAREQRKTAKQLRPNGGSSVADAINRIEDHVRGIEARVTRRIDGHSKEIETINKRLDEHMDGR